MHMCECVSSRQTAMSQVPPLWAFPLTSCNCREEDVMRLPSQRSRQVAPPSAFVLTRYNFCSCRGEDVTFLFIERDIKVTIRVLYLPALSSVLYLSFSTIFNCKNRTI